MCCSLGELGSGLGLGLGLGLRLRLRLRLGLVFDVFDVPCSDYHRVMAEMRLSTGFRVIRYCFHSPYPAELCLSAPTHVLWCKEGERRIEVPPDDSQCRSEMVTLTLAYFWPGSRGLDKFE